MSEFSESFHLKSDDAQDAVALLSAARVPGFVAPAKNGWVSFVYEPDEPPAKDHFDAIVAAARGTLVHYDFAEDHGCTVTVYVDGKRKARARVSFESRRTSFDRDVFVKMGLLKARGADAIQEWLGFAVPGHVVAEQLGLPYSAWFSYEYARRRRDQDEPGMRDFVEVDEGGRVLDGVEPLGANSPPLSTRWDALAEAAVKAWLRAGSIELAEGASPADLADALADVLARQPTSDELEEFLLENDDVAEVFASGSDLVKTARGG